MQLFLFKDVETDRNPVVFFFLGAICFLKMEKEGKMKFLSQ